MEPRQTGDLHCRLDFILVRSDRDDGFFRDIRSGRSEWHL